VKFTRKSVLDRITAAPTRYSDMVGASKPARARLRKIIDRLVADGVIKQVYIDRFPYYVLANWRPSAEEKLAEIVGRGRRTVDGCLLWSEYVDPVVGPLWHATVERGSRSVRRLVWELSGGKPLKYRDVIKPRCENAACIEFTHLRKTSRAEPQAGRPKAPVHAMRIARAAQAGAKKLDWEKVHAIRASAESAAALALRYGVSTQTISAIWRHEIWKERATGMFSGLINGRRAA